MSELIEYRDQIDAIDTQILSLLSQRFEIVKKVGRFKKLHHLPSLQPQRWQEVLKNRKQIGHTLGLDEKMVEIFWNQIHDFALHIEENI